MKTPVKKLVRIAVIAVLYYVLTVVLQAFSYGPLQFRIGEALTILPCVCPEATLGLTIGCLLANITSPYGWVDIVFGTLATLVAGGLTLLFSYLLRNKKTWVKAMIGGIPPVLVNAFIIPLIWFFMGVEEVYWFNVLFMFITEGVMVYVVGIPLVLALDRTKILKK